MRIRIQEGKVDPQKRKKWKTFHLEVVCVLFEGWRHKIIKRKNVRK
jgi:hypothetical protein